MLRKSTEGSTLRSLAERSRLRLPGAVKEHNRGFVEDEPSPHSVRDIEVKIMTALIEVDIAIAGTAVDFNVFPISGANARLTPFIVTTTLDDLLNDTLTVKVDVQDAIDDASLVEDPAAVGPG